MVGLPMLFRTHMRLRDVLLHQLNSLQAYKNHHRWFFPNTSNPSWIQLHRTHWKPLGTNTLPMRLRPTSRIYTAPCNSRARRLGKCGGLPLASPLSPRRIRPRGTRNRRLAPLCSSPSTSSLTTIAYVILAFEGRTMEMAKGLLALDVCALHFLHMFETHDPSVDTDTIKDLAGSFR